MPEVLAFSTASTGVIALVAGVAYVPGATVAVNNGSVKTFLTSPLRNSIALIVSGS